MKLAIGIIAYNEITAKYLPYFLNSLDKQTCRDFELLVFDNSEKEDNVNVKILSEKGIGVDRLGVNAGFARAYNFLIKKALENGAEYFFVVNPDVILEPDALEKMLAILNNDKKLASVCPKINVWDFENNKKTNIIDTLGIVEISALRFKDLGQGEDDRGQYENSNIIGPSGAAGFYRLSALEKVKDAYGYFDERMFMYEEDCELAYRLKMAGYSSKCVSDAVIYHDRTAKAKGTGNLQVALNRKNKGRNIKAWAFKNKHLIFIKHWKTLDLRRKIEVLWFGFRMFVFALVFERYLLKEYKGLLEVSSIKYKVSR